MRRIALRRPSPALVVACLALLVALGGTGYATVLQVPRASVGAPQLKNGAVTTTKLGPGCVCQPVLGTQPPQRVAARDLVRAVGRHQQDRQLAQGARQGREQLERGVV